MIVSHDDESCAWWCGGDLCLWQRGLDRFHCGTEHREPVRPLVDHSDIKGKGRQRRRQCATGVASAKDQDVGLVRFHLRLSALKGGNGVAIQLGDVKLGSAAATLSDLRAKR